VGGGGASAAPVPPIVKRPPSWLQAARIFTADIVGLVAHFVFMKPIESVNERSQNCKKKKDYEFRSVRKKKRMDQLGSQ
jgi:hypothetical protein